MTWSLPEVKKKIFSSDGRFFPKFGTKISRFILGLENQPAGEMFSSDYSRKFPFSTPSLENKSSDEISSSDSGEEVSFSGPGLAVKSPDEMPFPDPGGRVSFSIPDSENNSF